MFGKSQALNELFVFKRETTLNSVDPKTVVATEILPLSGLKRHHLKRLRRLQGQFAVSYLKFKYSSPNTHVLLAYVNEDLAHAEWIVPWYRLRRRYSFVTKDSYSIISCFTAERFRGLAIYASQIQRVVRSDIPSSVYWMWAESTNVASLKGICRAGGTKVGEFLFKRWFWGTMARSRML
ncbi:MAG: hypothetical protein ACYTEL_04120 [Planctomycetota bacterium]|jgi:hypothetical protein